MRRFAILPLLALLLAACGGRDPLPPRTLKAVTGFTGPEAAAIEVRITEIPPGVRIERVVAVDPAGRVLAASELLRSENETGPGLVSRPSLGLAVTGGSSRGVNPSVGLGWQITGAGRERHSKQVTAVIPLLDPAAYRATVSQWRVDIHYRDVTGRRQMLSLPAPRIE